MEKNGLLLIPQRGFWSRPFFLCVNFAVNWGKWWEFLSLTKRYYRSGSLCQTRWSVWEWFFCWDQSAMVTSSVWRRFDQRHIAPDRRTMPCVIVLKNCGKISRGINNWVTRITDWTIVQWIITSRNRSMAPGNHFQYRSHRLTSIIEQNRHIAPVRRILPIVTFRPQSETNSFFPKQKMKEGAQPRNHSNSPFLKGS